MRPVLVALDQHGTRTATELEAYAAEVFGMTDAELAERLSSEQRRIRNRLGWATTDLEKAKFLEYGDKKGTYVATNAGRTFLASHPGPITDKDLLAESPDFAAWRAQSSKAKQKNPSKALAQATLPLPTASATPQEVMEAAYAEIKEALCDDLLQRVYAQDAYEFEHTVAKLLKAMGYGDSWGTSVQVTQKSGDGGVDGLVREDRLGFDVVYYQAKRWKLDATINAPEIQSFVGALIGKGSSKGLFITTAKFSQGARKYADGLKQQRVVLVDGKQMAELMVDHNVGVSTVETFEIKSIDSDFFGGE